MTFTIHDDGMAYSKANLLKIYFDYLMLDYYYVWPKPMLDRPSVTRTLKFIKLNFTFGGDRA